MVWRMIGSSPDVIMTSEEWHVGVFGSRKTLRKGLPLAFRSLGIRSFEPLRRYALRKTLEMQRPNDVTTKPDARSLVVKLMDYHIVFAEMIGTSFERATFVNLTRHPYGLCESLMRSGLSLEHACRWYDDVARMMVQQAEWGAISVRFEDVVTRPMETCDGLYRSLGVRWSEDGKFEFKVKPYRHRSHGRHRRRGQRAHPYRRTGCRPADRRIGSTGGNGAAVRCPTASHLGSHGRSGRPARLHRSRQHYRIGLTLVSSASLQSPAAGDLRSVRVENCRTDSPLGQ